MGDDQVDHCALVLQDLREFLEVGQPFVLLFHVTGVIVEVVLLLAEQHFLRELVLILLRDRLLVTHLLLLALGR